MSVAITAFYAAILGALFVPFTLYVGTYRAKNKILLLDGGDAELTRRIRAHANFTETVPLALILLILVELSGASPTLLHSLGIVLVVARTMHYVTIATNPGATAPRALGMVGTLGVILVSAGYLLLN